MIHEKYRGERYQIDSAGGARQPPADDLTPRPDRVSGAIGLLRFNVPVSAPPRVPASRARPLAAVVSTQSSGSADRMDRLPTLGFRSPLAGEGSGKRGSRRHCTRTLPPLSPIPPPRGGGVCSSTSCRRADPSVLPGRGREPPAGRRRIVGAACGRPAVSACRRLRPRSVPPAAGPGSGGGPGWRRSDRRRWPRRCHRRSARPGLRVLRPASRCCRRRRWP